MELTDTVTLAHFRVMAWLLVGMAIYNDKSMADIALILLIAQASHLWLSQNLQVSLAF